MAPSAAAQITRETALPKLNAGDNLPNESELTIQTYQ
jgi:hypothetical protein